MALVYFTYFCLAYFPPPISHGEISSLYVCFLGVSDFLRLANRKDGTSQSVADLSFTSEFILHPTLVHVLFLTSQRP